MEVKPCGHLLKHALLPVGYFVVAGKLVHGAEVEHHAVNHVGRWVFSDEAFEGRHCLGELTGVHCSDGQIIDGLDHEIFFDINTAEVCRNHCNINRGTFLEGRRCVRGCAVKDELPFA